MLITTNTWAQTPATLDLQVLLGKINTMQAKFKQSVYSEKKELLHNYQGNIEFKKPHMFRWQVDAPDPSLLITDGKKLWNYDVGLEQVTIENFTSNKEVTPLSFILDDINNLTKNFNIQEISHHCYKLTPKQENTNFVHVSVCFKNEKIVSVNIYDHLGQTSLFEFYEIKNNKEIANNRFSFTPPAGVDVLSEP